MIADRWTGGRSPQVTLCSATDGRRVCGWPRYHSGAYPVGTHCDEATGLLFRVREEAAESAPGLAAATPG